MEEELTEALDAAVAAAEGAATAASNAAAIPTSVATSAAASATAAAASAAAAQSALEAATNRVPLYPNRAAAAAAWADRPASLKSVRWVGPEGAVYGIVESVGDDLPGFEDARPDAATPSLAHYGAMGDNIADDSAAFAAAALSGRKIDGGGLTYRVDNPFALTAHTVIENATINCSGWPASGEVTLSGGAKAAAINLTTDTTSGSSQVTVGSTASFYAGDYCILRSNAVWSSAAGVNIGEIVRVKAVTSGTVLTLYGKVSLSYLTSDTARIERLTLVEGAGFRKVTFLSDGATQLDAVRFTYGLRPVLEDVRAFGFSDNGFALINCVGIEGGKHIESSDMGTLLAYAINISGCCALNFGTILGRRLRHAFTVGGVDFPSHDITVETVIGEECIAAPADTHAAARNVKIGRVENLRSAISTAGPDDGLVMQGANIEIGYADLTDCAGRIGAMFQPQIDYPGDWYVRAKGVVSNCGTTGLVLDIQGTAGLASADLDFTIINPVQFGANMNIQDGDVGRLSVKVTISGHTSDVYNPVRVRTYAGTAVGMARIDVLSETDDDADEHVYLLGDAANPLSNVTITGVIQNGLFGVRGTNVAPGTVNTAGLLILGATTPTSGL